VAIALGQPGHERLEAVRDDFERAFAAGLLEAEFWSVCRREGVAPDARHTDAISFVMPARSLVPEIERILDAGHLRGADLWHLACALYLSPDPTELTFLTLDRRQAEVASALGFRVATGD
jgi:hypothetical protein